MQVTRWAYFGVHLDQTARGFKRKRIDIAAKGVIILQLILSSFQRSRIP